jgi:hypothetical protein
MSAPYEDRPSGMLRAVTPDNDDDLPDGITRGLYVGVAGNIGVVDATGGSATIVGAQAGQILPLKVRRVTVTNTTATDIVALY